MNYFTRAGYSAGTYTSESSDTSASSAASGQGASASASSGPGYLKTQASANNAPAVWNPQAGASASERYSILGNLNNELLPLNFNFEFSGSISASSNPVPSRLTSNIGYAAITLGLTSTTSSPRTVSRYRGQASINVVNGIPEYKSSGVFKEGIRSVVIEPSLEFNINIFAYLNDGNVIDRLLTDELIRELGIELEFNRAIESSDFSGAKLAIVNAINLVPNAIQILFPGSRIAESLGFINLNIDVNYIFRDTVSLPVETSDSGSISTSLLSSVRTVSDAFAISDFSQSLILSSVTISPGYSFNNLDNPRVVFDSGVIFPIIYGEEYTFPDPIDLEDEESISSLHIGSIEDDDVTSNLLNLEESLFLSPKEKLGGKPIERDSYSNWDYNAEETVSDFTDQLFFSASGEKTSTSSIWKESLEIVGREDVRVANSVKESFSPFAIDHTYCSELIADADLVF
jgi:hypothetical protein